MVYNNSLYFIEKEDVYFFNNEDEACRFVIDNVSDRDNFHVIHITSVADVLKRIPYGQELHEQITKYIPIEKNDPDRNPLYDKDGNAFTDELIDHWEQQQLINNKTNVMNEENFEYLSKQLKYTGFPEEMTAVLQRHMEQDQPEFKMGLSSKFGEDNVESTLHFSQSIETGRYFFNRYEMSIPKEGEGQAHAQTFYIDQKGGNITLKEGYNLLNGRSVFKELHNKEGEKYNAWVQLDFKNTDKYGNFKLHKYNENYGYDLADKLSQHNIKELLDPKQKERLMESLERGNRQTITYTIGDKEHKLSIEAVPQFHSLNFYDNKQKPVNIQKLLNPEQEKKTVKQTNRQRQGQHVS